MNYSVAVVFVLTVFLVGPGVYKTSQAEQMMENIISQSPIVLELFTSQSCSSCPPADRLLSKLVENPDVIALGCHVTYWDHLSWKDTLSLPVCTERQRSYAAAQNSNRIFTPELRINGRISTVGADKTAVTKAVQQEANRLIKLDIIPEKEGFNITVPARLEGGEAYFLSYKNAHVQHIRSGENRGKTINYTHAVTEVKPLKITQNIIHIPIQYLTENTQGFAVLLHRYNARGLGNVIAAGTWEKISAK